MHNFKNLSAELGPVLALFFSLNQPFFSSDRTGQTSSKPVLKLSAKPKPSDDTLMSAVEDHFRRFEEVMAIARPAAEPSSKDGVEKDQRRVAGNDDKEATKDRKSESSKKSLKLSVESVQAIVDQDVRSRSGAGPSKAGSGRSPRFFEAERELEKYPEDRSKVEEESGQSTSISMTLKSDPRHTSASHHQSVHHSTSLHQSVHHSGSHPQSLHHLASHPQSAHHSTSHPESNQHPMSNQKFASHENMSQLDSHRHVSSQSKRVASVTSQPDLDSEPVRLVAAQQPQPLPETSRGDDVIDALSRRSSRNNSVGLVQPRQDFRIPEPDTPPVATSPRKFSGTDRSELFMPPERDPKKSTEISSADADLKSRLNEIRERHQQDLSLIKQCNLDIAFPEARRSSGASGIDLRRTNHSSLSAAESSRSNLQQHQQQQQQLQQQQKQQQQLNLQQQLQEQCQQQLKLQQQQQQLKLQQQQQQLNLQKQQHQQHQHPLWHQQLQQTRRSISSDGESQPPMLHFSESPEPDPFNFMATVKRKFQDEQFQFSANHRSSSNVGIGDNNDINLTSASMALSEGPLSVTLNSVRSSKSEKKLSTLSDPVSAESRRDKSDSKSASVSTEKELNNKAPREPLVSLAPKKQILKCFLS